jgi:hypothetical protein
VASIANLLDFADLLPQGPTDHAGDSSALSEPIRNCVPVTAFVLAVHIAFQLRRMHNEKGVLADCIPGCRAMIGYGCPAICHLR